MGSRPTSDCGKSRSSFCSPTSSCRRWMASSWRAAPPSSIPTSRSCSSRASRQWRSIPIRPRPRTPRSCPSRCICASSSAKWAKCSPPEGGAGQIWRSLPHPPGGDKTWPPSTPGFWARSSAEEHYLDMVGVTGSIPVAPTINPPRGGIFGLWRLNMKRVALKRMAHAGLLLGFVAVVGGASVAPSAYAARAASVLQTLDPDNDGTVDLAEAKAAGSKVFDSLDRDHDGTLDRRELKGHLGPNELTAADPDKDGTLDKSEYLALVEKRFSAANPDNDGTLDAKELNARAGRALLRLIK